MKQDPVLSSGLGLSVLHIAQKLPGGPASYLAEVLPWQLDRFGENRVKVLAPRDELGEIAQLPRSGCFGFPSSERGALSLARFAQEAVRVIRREQPDIVHLHSTFAGALRPLVRYLPRAPRPAIVYCAHGWAFNMDRPAWQRSVYAGIERGLAGLADQTIAISRFEGRTARDKGIPEGNLQVIDNGVAADLPEAGRNVRTLPQDKLNLLFIGRLDEQKGFDILEEAMGRLVNLPIHLHVIGGSVVGKARHNDQERPNITHYGWQSRESVRGFIDAASAVVMPSRWEGFGLVAIEAMRQSKPVVASRVDALPDVVGDTGVLFAPQDPEALACVLAGLEREQLAELGARARTRFLERFTAERMNREIFECYKAAMAVRDRTLGQGG